MGNRFIKNGGGIICGALFVALSLPAGCDRSEPPPAQTTAPVAAPQPSQPQMAVPAPSPQPVQTTPQPQQAAPAPAVTQPAAVPAPSPPPAVSQGTVSQNFSRVQMGMTSQEVLQLLGNPTKSKQKHQEAEWEYYTPQGEFEIEFQMDRVVKIEKH